MALMMRKPIETEKPLPVVPRVFDDPRHSEPAAVLAALRQHLRQLELLRQRLILERHLAGKPVDARSSTDQMLRQRLAKLQTETADMTAPTVPMAAAAIPPAVAAALALIRGETIPPAPDHAAQIAEIDAKMTVLDLAIREQAEIVDGVVDQISAEIATDLKPAWDSLQLELYRAAQELARTTRRVRQLRADIAAAGVRSRSDLLLTPNVRAPLMLGDESHWDSEIAGWRRMLEQWGLLK